MAYLPNINWLTKYFQVITLVLYAAVVIFHLIFSIQLHAKSTNTDLELKITELTVSQPPYILNSEQIITGDRLIFTLGPVKSDQGQILSGLDCKLYIQPPTKAVNEQLSFAMKINNQGLCIYDTATSPQTLESAKKYSIASLNNINSLIGQGQSFGEVNYKNQTIKSNIKKYTVLQAQTSSSSSNNFSSSLSSISSRSSSSPGQADVDLPRTGGLSNWLLAGTIMLMIIIIVYWQQKRKKISDPDY